VTRGKKPPFAHLLFADLFISTGETFMTETVCYVNGDFVSLKDAALPVRDLSILRGYGVFDFLRTYNGKPLNLRRNLQRLQTSARHVFLNLPWSMDELEQIVLDTLSRNTIPEASIRIVVTGGVAVDGITPPETPSLLVLITPVRIYPAECSQQGIKVVTVETERYIPGAKTINYIPAIMALKKAKAAGAMEALYVNRQQHILEGTTTNFFVFQGSKLITPGDDILPGITRDVVLELAQDKFEVTERPILFGDLPRADEAFITASNKEIMPVRQVNDVIIGDGVPGLNTQLVMKLFRQLTRGE
jgi:branched-chain amino acid aminotransferase